jgi:hypothetical protein
MSAMTALLTRQSSTCFSSKHEGVRYANASQHQDAKLSHPIVRFASVHLCHCAIDSQPTYTSNFFLYRTPKKCMYLIGNLSGCLSTCSTVWTEKDVQCISSCFFFRLLFLQVSWYAYTTAECISSNTCVSTKQPIKSRHNDLQ